MSQDEDAGVMFINLLGWSALNWDQLLLFRYFSDNSIKWTRRRWFKVSPLSQKSKRGKTDRLRRMEEREAAWEKQGDCCNSWADGLAAHCQGHLTFEIIVCFWLLYKILCLTDCSFFHPVTNTLTRNNLWTLSHPSNWYIVPEILMHLS